MVEEAQKLAKLSEHVVVKIPLIPDGIKLSELYLEKALKLMLLLFLALTSFTCCKSGS